MDKLNILWTSSDKDTVIICHQFQEEGLVGPCKHHNMGRS
jgi:hypothetical protein